MKLKQQSKNYKSIGVDNVLNEFLKYCHINCLKLVLDIGMVPTEWCMGIIYVKRGLVSHPDNYRGITLFSCTSKLFTSCFNSRLSCYVEENIVCQE